MVECLGHADPFFGHGDAFSKCSYLGQAEDQPGAGLHRVRDCYTDGLMV